MRPCRSRIQPGGRRLRETVDHRPVASQPRGPLLRGRVAKGQLRVPDGEEPVVRIATGAGDVEPLQRVRRDGLVAQVQTANCLPASAEGAEVGREGDARQHRLQVRGVGRPVLRRVQQPVDGVDDVVLGDRLARTGRDEPLSGRSRRAAVGGRTSRCSPVVGGTPISDGRTARRRSAGGRPGAGAWPTGLCAGPHTAAGDEPCMGCRAAVARTPRWTTPVDRRAGRRTRHCAPGGLA